jgi:uncharacterized protein YqgC (DUF456 family)
MTAEIAATILCGLLIAAGMAGVVIPILPGSITVAVGLLLWALALHSPLGWVVFAVGMVFVAAGMLAGTVLTGRRLKARQVPNRSILIGVVAGIAGMFVLPVLGLFLGFALGLLLSELVRRRDWHAATGASLAALKAMGIGMLAELGCAFGAATVWSIGVVMHFFF